MPLYEYECKENGHRFEVMQNVKDKPLKSCKFCNAGVKKLISSGRFVLKGAGFYMNDYASPKKEGKGAPKKNTTEKEVKNK